jgi:hypothetical protein
LGPKAPAGIDLELGAVDGDGEVADFQDAGGGIPPFGFDTGETSTAGRIGGILLMGGGITKTRRTRLPESFIP